MYLQPYGDEQQLNLNWIINEIINLHKQLDPDYETPSFTQVYPYSNLNRLNLDWVLSELKALKELAPEPTPEVDIQAVAEALVALPFDSNTSYQIYDFISKDGEIWRATEAIAAGGEWDSSKWFKTKIGTDLAVLERWINTINNSLTAEIQARQDADTALQSNIDNEALARQNADTALQSNIDNEALARQNADTALQNNINGLTSANISDDSDAGGANVKASLNNLKGAINAITPLDTVPTNDSTKGITSDAVYEALSGKQATLIDISTTTPFTIQSSEYNLNCRRFGKIVCLDMFNGPKTLTAQGGWVTVATLPTEYRPSSDILVNTKFNDTNVQIRVGTSGVISMAGVPAITDAYLVINITYLV